MEPNVDGALVVLVEAETCLYTSGLTGDVPEGVGVACTLVMVVMYRSEWSS